MKNRDTVVFSALSVGLATSFFLLFFIYPAVRGFYISLFDWDGFSANMRFVGVGNYAELFTDIHFWTVVMKNTFAIIFIGGGAVFFLALLFSHLLTGDVPGKSFLRAAIFFPNVVNPVALAILWSFIYNQEWGLLNGTLELVGLGQFTQTWTGPDGLFWALLIGLVWIFVGFYTVILVSALDQVPSSFIEAAILEGASPSQVFWRIKLPLIRNVLSIALVLWVITAMKQFAFLYSWGGGGSFPQEGQQNLAVYMYAMSFGSREAIYRMGYSSAMGVLMLAIVGILVLLFWKLSGRDAVRY